MKNEQTRHSNKQLTIHLYIIGSVVNWKSSYIWRK